MDRRRSLSRLVEAAGREGLDGLLLLYGPNLTYATGLRGVSGVLAAGPGCEPVIAVGLLDYDRVQAHAPHWLEVKAFYRGGEESIEVGLPRGSLVKGGLADAAKSLASECGFKRVGVDLGQLAYSVAGGVREKLSAAGIEVVDASRVVAGVRRVKEDWEVELIERAARLAEEALRRVLDSLGPEASEAGLAGLVHAKIMELGGWGEAFPTIVAFHEDTAYPHHTPTTRPLGESGPVLVDLGAVVEGYHSDMTRSLWYGDGGSRYKELVEAVAEAQAEALDTIAPGVAAWEPDRAARRVLEKRGLARYFIHGLGHGVGVEIHEEPYLRPASKEELEPGNVVTVEPGVYIPGVHGVRIEDLVLVTRKGRRLLTRFSRILA